MALRLGKVDGEKKTLEETGKAFKLTKERVRQVEQKYYKSLENK